MDLARYTELRQWILAHPEFARDYWFYVNVQPPQSPKTFAEEAAFVICNSGMRAPTARKVYERTMPYVRSGGKAIDRFRHPGKAAAIDTIWRRRADLLSAYQDLEAAADRLEFLGNLPWIGGITKFHLAKNFGVDCVKPDRWLERLAGMHGTTPEKLCSALAEKTGEKISCVDYVLFRCASEGMIHELKAFMNRSAVAPELEL